MKTKKYFNKSKVKKIFVFLIICSFILIILFLISKVRKYNILLLEALSTNHLINNTQNSYNVEKLPQGWKIEEDINLGFNIQYPEILKIYKYDQDINKGLMKNVIYIRNETYNSEQFTLKIVPLAINPTESALNALEIYILKNVGTIEKNNQKIIKNNGFDIAQIGYNPFLGDNSKYFSIYTLFKKNDKAWILATGYYADATKTDALDKENSLQSSLYNQIINSFKDIKTNNPAKFNFIDTTTIDSKTILEFKNNNNIFDTTF